MSILDRLPQFLMFIAENIRRIVSMNYKDILDEMQMALVNETLSRCIGDVDMIKEK